MSVGTRLQAVGAHIYAKLQDFYAKLQDFALRSTATAAIEFAMVLPVMLTAYIGSVEVGGGVTADRKLASLSLTLANLTARYNLNQGIQDSDINGVFNASAAVLSPYDYTKAGMVITSFVFDSGVANPPNAYVVWSDATGPGAVAMTPSCTNAISTTIVPANLRTQGGSVILGQANFPYHPPIGYVVTGTVNLSEVNFMVPRYKPSIARTNSSTGKTYSTCVGSSLAP
ncbi:Flp pilus assembly protein TadG [Rhizobiales bacterium GAS191]|jgi:Flp pilus assembly protein TadG|nr:Flp pilus assembly protein TadG [Rhizobiales bacterium GAS113]SEC86589.1 Flp pilus assembly protein TadG [Rhizobiales bacterium GAS191]